MTCPSYFLVSPFIKKMPPKISLIIKNESCTTSNLLFQNVLLKFQGMPTTLSLLPLKKGKNLEEFTLLTDLKTD